jgi:hypothetical protein
MSDSPAKAASRPYKARSACGKATLSQYPGASVADSAPQSTVERT